MNMAIIHPPLTEPDAPGQIYKIKEDKGELKNLWYKEKDMVKKLQKELETMLQNQ